MSRTTMTMVWVGGVAGGAAEAAPCAPTGPGAARHNHLQD